MSAPLVVNTADGTVWTRREATRDGLALYAPEKCAGCPEFVMATYAELEGHGVAGSADVLPVPVGPEPLSAERLADIAARAGIATEGPWRVVEGHEIHQGAEFGDFAVYVAQTDPDCGCVQSVADAEFIAHAREDVPALLAENDRLRARVAELEAERHSTNEALDGKYPPALPWAALMDDEDLQEFLGDLLDSLNSNPPSTRAVLAEVEKTCSTWRLVAEAQHGHNTAPGPDERPVNELTSVFSPVASLREPEGEHWAAVHHSYRVPRDLPETGGAK